MQGQSDGFVVFKVRVDMLSQSSGKVNPKPFIHGWTLLPRHFRARALHYVLSRVWAQMGFDGFRVHDHCGADSRQTSMHR